MAMSIGADFPFQSKYLNIDGSKIHYVEEGKGKYPILFLHVVRLPLIYGGISYLL